MNSSNIPNWIMNRYKILFSEFDENPFRFSDAARVLMNKNKDQWEQIPAFLSELRKEGLLTVEADRRDAREKIYRLKNVEQHIGRGEIDSLLKKAADLIRTRVDYKFILILLFLKRISDKWDVEFEEAYRKALADGLTEEQARKEAARSEFHWFNLPEEYHWENIRRDVAGLTERLSKALKTIADLNPDLKIIFDSVDFIQFTSSRENTEILRQLVELFSEKKLNHVSADILGDAYEWILRYFAPAKAKEGEIYTPREVIKLLIEILDPKPLETVYDPACGSGGMLITAYKHVEEKHGGEEASKLFLYGQESNQSILALAKMNMFIHDIRDSHLEYGDTLLYPKFKEKDTLQQFDIVVANPPWNQDGYGEDTLKKAEFWKQRYTYGFTPRQSADWAWIQHMIASAKEETGRIGVVLDNGCLFRGGREKSIRTAILEEDLIESVILLPEKLFYNTGAPGAILIFRKNKPLERRNKILFINASKEFEQNPEVRKLNTLSPNNIKKIAGAYKNFSEEKNFSKIISLNEIKQNDYNLNITLYIMPEEETEQINIAAEFQALKQLEKEKQALNEKLEQYLHEIIKAQGDIP